MIFQLLVCSLFIKYLYKWESSSKVGNFGLLERETFWAGLVKLSAVLTARGDAREEAARHQHGEAAGHGDEGAADAERQCCQLDGAQSAQRLHGGARDQRPDGHGQRHHTRCGSEVRGQSRAQRGSK